MNFYKTSRKDDIIAVLYILMVQLNHGKPIGKQKDVELLSRDDEDMNALFTAYRSYKEKYTIKNLVKYAKKYQMLN